MAIGDPGDFRTEGFKQVQRFPGLGSRGGSGSAFLPQFTPPAGSTSSGSIVPPLTLPQLGPSTFNFPAGSFNIPSIQLPTINPFIPSAGTTTTTTLTVGDGTTSYTGINTITVSGTLSLSSTGATSVDIFGSGGGGGGTSLKYAKITGSSKIVSTEARWSYTVVIYTAGIPAASSVTAYNLLEKENTSSSAYGYAVTGGDQVTGTSYYVRAVPTNTWIRMEQTSDITGTPTYWFSAPNFMDGTC